MKQKILLFLIWFYLSGNVTAQNSAGVESPSKHEFLPLLYQLADDQMQGREIGTEGGEKAAAFIAEKMKSTGIQEYDSDYYQSFQLLKTSVVSASLNILNFENDSVTLTSNLNQELFFLSCADDLDIASDVVFAGYGLVNDDSSYNSFAHTGVRDKIIIVLEGIPGEADTNGIVWQQYGKFFQQQDNLLKIKRNNARNFGAKAIVLLKTSKKTDSFVQWISDITGDDWVNYPDSDYWFVGENQKNCLPMALCNSNSSEQLAEMMHLNLSETALSLAHTKDINFSDMTFLWAKLTAKLNHTQIEARNVIGMIKGVDSTQTIIIGGHYDHLGQRGHSIYNGADDNASGASGVVALAQKWATHGVFPKHNLLFACWDGEEKGLFGSRYFVSQLTDNEPKVKLYINMDMISRSAVDDSLQRVLSVGIRAQDTSLIQMARQCNINTNYAFDLDIWDVNGHSGSDYAGFVANEIPVMTFFSGFHNDYHSPRDTRERTDAEKMERILRLVNECLQEALK